MDEPVCGDELYVPGRRNADGTQEGCSAVRQALYVLEQPSPEEQRDRGASPVCALKSNIYDRDERHLVPAAGSMCTENQHR